MSYLTLEVEVDHGRVVSKEPGKLPEKGRGLPTILQCREARLLRFERGDEAWAVVAEQGVDIKDEAGMDLAVEGGAGRFLGGVDAVDQVEPMHGAVGGEPHEVFLNPIALVGLSFVVQVDRCGGGGDFDDELWFAGKVAVFADPHAAAIAGSGTKNGVRLNDVDVVEQQGDVWKELQAWPDEGVGEEPAVD